MNEKLSFIGIIPARFASTRFPCKIDGVCHNCNSPQCICNYIHFTRNSFPAHRHTVILLGEPWGY